MINSTELGRVLYEINTRWGHPGGAWTDLAEDQRQFWVDYAQGVLDRLAAEGIIK